MQDSGAFSHQDPGLPCWVSCGVSPPGWVSPRGWGSPWMDLTLVGLRLDDGSPPGGWVSPWRVGLPLDRSHPGGSPLDWSPPGGWVSSWMVGLPVDRSHPGGSPMDGSPPGGWVSPWRVDLPWWVSPGWVSPWRVGLPWMGLPLRVSVAALLRNGLAHVQSLGAQPGKDFLWDLKGLPPPMLKLQH